MIYQQVIARRYARGLMLSLKEGDFDEVLAQLKLFCDLATITSLELKRVLEDPAFSPLDRRAVINKIASKSSMHPQLHHFLLLLVEKNRMALLSLIYEALLILIDSHQARLRVKIVSASSVSPEEVFEITESLKKSLKKDVMAELKIDPSLLGGMRIEVGGTVFDGSLKAKLAGMKHKLQLGQ
jgi:F-type H+-transporting ATPase subunit delta